MPKDTIIYIPAPATFRGKNLIKNFKYLPDMATESEIKEKYMEFQMIQQHMQQITEHIEQMNQQALELEISANAIKELEKTDIHTEFLAPLANGIFVKGELKENAKLIINVGSDVTVERTPAEVIALLHHQKQEVVEKTSEAQAVMQELQQYAMRLYKEVEKQVKEE